MMQAALRDLSNNQQPAFGGENAPTLQPTRGQRRKRKENNENNENANPNIKLPRKRSCLNNGLREGLGEVKLQGAI
jgi:hypothetical protein